jgi:8-oxo-dGTP diphosphatase
MNREFKQIFSAYPYQNNNGLTGIRYCPYCGCKYELRQESGRMRPVCLKCGKTYYKNPSPGVAVLIVEDQQVLLCKRAPGNFQSGKWCLPCGFIEYEEDFLTAARREVKEETGLEVTLKAIINVASNFLSPEVHSLVTVFTADITGGNLLAGDDIEELGWSPITGPLPEMAFEADIMIIRQFYEKRPLGISVE